MRGGGGGGGGTPPQLINHSLLPETKEERTCNFTYLVRKVRLEALYRIRVVYCEKRSSYNQIRGIGI